MNVQKIAIEYLAQIVAAALIALAVVFLFSHYRNLKEAAAVSDVREQVLTNASAGVSDGVDIDAQQQAYAQGLAYARATFKDQKDEAKRNEPETADRAVRAIPDSVRNAARQRRLARERLGCAGRECEERR
jgi:acyl-CoA synthetase (AMP-forming)/AMP-acid ligase II